MRTEKGGVVLFILIILLLCGLIVGGMFVFKKLNTTKVTSTVPKYDSSVEIEGNSAYVKMDFSKTPSSPELLKHHMNHCNATPGHKWDGKACIKTEE